MSVSKYSLRMVGMFAVLTLLVCSAYGQYRASIQGVVTDPQGAVVQGATVTLKNLDTNQTLVATTNDAGIYNFSALPPNRYSLTVEKDGFRKKVLDNVGVIAEQANALNVQLDVGAVTESVVVSGDSTPLIDTQTASVSGTVTDNQIQHMPSFGRDVFQLVQLAPGMFGDGAQAVNGGAQLPGTQGPGGTGGNQGIFQTENGPQALAVGQQYENNSYTIDGISTTSAVWGGTTIITPTEDSIDSVKVLSNGYDAENGRFSGAQVQVISKSGTNEYHGSAFFTAHRPGLNAYQSFNGQGNAVLRDPNFFDQFGASGGGPILKNKLFAFFAWETVRSPAAQKNFANGWYDTSAFDALAPSGSIASKYLTFAGNAPNVVTNNNATCADAGLIDAAHVSAAHPTPNCAEVNGGLNIGTPLTTALGTQDLTWTSTSNPGVGSGLGTAADIANYETESASNFSKNQYNGRVDYNISNNDRLSLTLYYVPQSSSFLNGPAREYNFFHHSQVNEAFSAIWDHTFSSTWVNEFRTNAAGWRWNEINSNPQSPVGLPSDNIGQIGSISLSSFGPNVGSILDQWTYSYKDVATKILGRHTIKFGGELTRLFYLNDCAGCGVPSYTFFNPWDFLNDAPHAEGGGFNPNTGFPTTIRQDDRQDFWGFFAQDDFKLRRNLTLNLGLRYNYFGPLSSKEGNMYVATPGAGPAYLTGLVVHKGDSWNAQKDNLGPQIGIAWSPDRLLGHEFKGRLVIRGGYGLNYNQEEIAISANIGNNPGLVVFPSLSMSTPTSPNPGIIYSVSSGIHNLTGYPANPNTVLTFGPNGLPVGGVGLGVGIFPNTLPTMRVHHYSVDVQYDLGFQTVATVSYQGSLSRNIFFHENPNAVPAASGFALNPQIGGGDYWGVNGYGNYNAMLAELNHRFSQQFMADAQYSWAKCMDTSSGPYFEQPYPYNTSLDYGRCDYNVQNAFKLYGMWQPVFFHGSNAWLEKLAGGWSISGIFNIHSGFPWSPVVSVVGGSLYCGTCGYTTLFPGAYLGGAGNSTTNSAFRTGSNYPNGGAAYFSVPTYTAFGGTTFGSALPQSPGVARNSLNGPGYRDVDLTLAKAFGLPKLPILGENARFEFRMDAYNLFNNLNFNPGSISNNIANANFGQATQAFAGRIVTLGARFSF